MVPSICEEAFGLTVVEGMNYEIPIIVTNSGGIPEIVHKDYELMVNRDLNIIQNLKDKMKCVYEDKNTRKDKQIDYILTTKNILIKSVNLQMKNAVIILIF